ncbi:MAG TPA: phage GP46 family protein [Tardiphaga sp.]
MADTTTVWVPALGRGDWVLSGADLQTGRDLVTAVLISIFTDRVAGNDDEIPDGSGDPRGWWADADERYPIGSRLWLLSRAKQTAETQARAQDYLTECVQWLIDDGVVASFDIETAWIATGSLGARVTANKSDGTTVVMNFDAIWQGLN